MKKIKGLGFTMIEMLATIIVLLVILLIATPSIRRMIIVSNEVSKSYTEEIVLDAAREYASVNNREITSTLKLVDDTKIISLQTLSNMGLIEEEDLTSLGPNARVLLTLLANSNIKFEIVYDDTLVENAKPQIILLGDNPHYVKQGTVYRDPGYIAFDRLGNNVTDNVSVSGTVNTSILGSVVIDYALTDDEGNIADALTRTVIVVDSTYPTVTVATAVSNNAYNNKFAKNGDTITLSLTFSKTVTDPIVTIGNRIATVTGSGTTRTAIYTIPAGETVLVSKELGINISNYEDIYENQGITKTNVTSGGKVVYDNIKPIFSSFATTPTPTTIAIAISGAYDNNGGIRVKYYNNSSLITTIENDSYTYTGLSPASNHSVSFEIMDIAGNVSNLASRSVTTDVNIPIAVVATGGSTAQGQQITVSWSANGNPSNIIYHVYMSTDNITFNEIGTTTSTSYTHTGLPLGNNSGGTVITRYYKVKSEIPSGSQSAQTASVVGNTLASPVLSISKTGTLNSGLMTVNLSWPSVAGASGYILSIFDGTAYRYKNIGNVTSWNSDIAKIYPTSAQIAAWDSVSDPFRWNGDGLSLPSNINPLYLKANGAYTTSNYYTWIHVYSYDSGSRPSGGVWSGATSVCGENPDTDRPSKPSIALKYDSAVGAAYTSGTWTNKNLYQVQSSSDVVGVTSYQYSHAESPWAAAAMPVNWGITWEGDWNFYVRAIDAAGNSSVSSDVYTLRIDKTAPAVTVHTPASRAASGDNISIEISGGADTASGISNYEYCYTTNGTNCTPNTSGSTISLTANGNYTVCSRAKDVAGNVGTTTCSAANAYIKGVLVTQYRTKACTAYCASSACTCATWNTCEACGCATYSAYTEAVTYPSSCSASGSVNVGTTYTTCSVNTYKCNCKCVTTGATWSTTWWGTTACTATRCWNNGGGSCNVGNITATATYTVVTYKKTVYTRTCTGYCASTACTCAAYNTCEACGCSTWSSTWSAWSSTPCTASSILQCESQQVYQ